MFQIVIIASTNLFRILACIVVIVGFTATRTWSADQESGGDDPTAQWVFAYPWNTASSAGDFAEVRRFYSVLHANHYTIRLGCEDDFLGDTAGYHFKQVLVNGEVVWKKDVASGGPGMESIEVDVTEQVKGKSSVTVALRVIDLQGVTDFGVVAGWSDVEVEGMAPAEGSAWQVNTHGTWQALHSAALGSFQVP